MSCIITGCDLIADNEGKITQGDLHRVGRALVFNAVLNDKGETLWLHYDDSFKPLTYRHNAIICDSNLYFERRGVIVLDEGAAIFNDAAKAYLEKWE